MRQVRVCLAGTRPRLGWPWRAGQGGGKCATAAVVGESDRWSKQRMQASIGGVISTDNGVFRVCFRPCFRGVNRWWWAKCANIFGYKFKVI